jgi:hypothetical protein
MCDTPRAISALDVGRSVGSTMVSFQVSCASMLRTYARWGLRLARVGREDVERTEAGKAGSLLGPAAWPSAAIVPGCGGLATGGGGGERTGQLRPQGERAAMAHGRSGNLPRSGRSRECSPIIVGPLRSRGLVARSGSAGACPCVACQIASPCFWHRRHPEWSGRWSPTRCHRCP